MRIAYYTHTAFFEPALCLVRELSQRAHVDLLLEISPGAWESAAFDLANRPLPTGLVPADDVLADAYPPGVRAYWQSVASFHLVVHPTRRGFHPRSWQVSREALRFVASRGASVLHIDDVDVSPRLAIALPGARHPPVVIAVHDPQPHSGERNWRRHVSRRLAYPSAGRFVTYNRALADRFAVRYGIPPGAIQSARLGPYDVFREWGSVGAAGPPTVLFFGRISPYKGLDVFYEAAQRIAARVQGVRFVVAGQPIPGYAPPQPPVLPGSTIDVIERYLSNAEAARLFQSASVVVCPYRDATQSGVVLTAFAFRVPVVATATGGLPEYVIPDRTGLIVPPDDAPAVADAVARILVEPLLAARLRAGIEAAAADELSWRRTADTLTRLYADLISDR